MQKFREKNPEEKSLIMTYDLIKLLMLSSQSREFINFFAK